MFKVNGSVLVHTTLSDPDPIRFEATEDKDLWFGTFGGWAVIEFRNKDLVIPVHIDYVSINAVSRIRVALEKE